MDRTLTACLRRYRTYLSTFRPSSCIFAATIFGSERMRLRRTCLTLPALVLLATASIAQAQQPTNATAAAPQGPPAPNVGDMAPDFTFRGVTRYGILRDPAKLSDYRGQTVVLWLFIKARTRG
jgi:hypothetical protein